MFYVIIMQIQINAVCCVKVTINRGLLLRIVSSGVPRTSQSKTLFFSLYSYQSKVHRLKDAIFIIHSHSRRNRYQWLLAIRRE